MASLTVRTGFSGAWISMRGYSSHEVTKAHEVRSSWLRVFVAEFLLRPRRVRVHVDDRLHLRRRDLWPDVRTADALVARVAALEHDPIVLLELDAVLLGDRVLHQREAARVDAVEDALQLDVGAV